MSTFFHFLNPRQRSAGLRVLGMALLASTAPALHAAKASKKADAQDSGPVLMSKTGGGDMWADVKELQQAAAKGNPKAQAQLGEMLLRGDGIAKDAKRGVELLEKAARAGNSAAAFRVGMLLMKGEPGVVAEDQERALAYFRAAAAGGEKEAFFNIGAAYGSGKGVKRDYGEALGWLMVARQRGADAAAEKELRARISTQPTWIAKGERRAKEIQQEFTGKKTVDLLPLSAPLDAPVVAATAPEPSLTPTGLSKPDLSLKPSIGAPQSPRPTDDLRPSLPSLPPPNAK